MFLPMLTGKMRKTARMAVANRLHARICMYTRNLVGITRLCRMQSRSASESQIMPSALALRAGMALR
jgi:hypothetical protein